MYSLTWHKPLRLCTKKALLRSVPSQLLVPVPAPLLPLHCLGAAACDELHAGLGEKWVLFPAVALPPQPSSLCRHAKAVLAEGEVGSTAAGMELAGQGRGVTTAFGRRDDLSHLDVHMRLYFPCWKAARRHCTPSVAMRCKETTQGNPFNSAIELKVATAAFMLCQLLWLYSNFCEHLNIFLLCLFQGRVLQS